ncbi:hypothetical protein VNO78_00049 [Psophocarpus tetragonolobus]|uniref:BOI-related E3 ubiquitin-protein ligase 3 n=1 Tax=Psophocarpus tetragonolobus TaxID=3891 RepID=A0AAN9T8U7_PSOTE
MAIEAQLYPNKAGFPFCGSKNLMIEPCLNPQPQAYTHSQAGEQQCLGSLNPNMSLVDPTFLCYSNSNIHHTAINKYNHLSSCPQLLPIHLHPQREIDHFITSQNEKLRILLQEQRKQHVTELLKKVEPNALRLLRQKDEEIAQATKKSSELKEFLRRLEVENQSWRKVAEENEAIVLSLHNTLEQMKERKLYRMTTEDAASCCDDNMRNTAMKEGTGENRGWRGGVGEVEQNRKRTMDCKCCNSQKSCFMFLPCRHLCSCKTCEPFLQLCPICSMPKKSSIETLIV